MDKLALSKVLIFGLGGVGGYVAEALARSGVGVLGVVDNDVVNESNLNRQIIATKDTIGLLKTEAVKQRIKAINPSCKIITYNIFFMPETIEIPIYEYDYVVDAIDTVTAKINLVERCTKLNIPIISSMGTGNKIHPEMLEISDIYKTSVCPLAKVMRKELKARGIKHLQVVYSKEEPIKSSFEQNGRNIPGSTAFVPSAAGLIIAGKVVRDITGLK